MILASTGVKAQLWLTAEMVLAPVHDLLQLFDASTQRSWCRDVYYPARSSRQVNRSPTQSTRANVFQHIAEKVEFWRHVSTSEMKRQWVHACVESAVVALHNGSLAAEESTSVCHKVVFIESHGERDLSPVSEAAWQVVWDRQDWWSQRVAGCSCIVCAGCHCEQCVRP